MKGSLGRVSRLIGGDMNKRLSTTAIMASTFVLAAAVHPGAGGAALALKTSFASSDTSAATTVSFVPGVEGIQAGTPYEWTVPVGVTSIQVVADGAGGAGGADFGGAGDGGAGDGGAGARVTARMTVTPGQTLEVTVGGATYHPEDPGTWTGKGGGMSVVRDSADDSNLDVLTVAGGGGGGGTLTRNGFGGNGGDGGGTDGAGGAGSSRVAKGVSSGQGGSGGTGGLGGSSVDNGEPSFEGSDGAAWIEGGWGGAYGTPHAGSGGDGYGGGGGGGYIQEGFPHIDNDIGEWWGSGGGAGGSIGPDATYSKSPVGFGGEGTPHWSNLTGRRGHDGQVMLTFTPEPTPNPNPTPTPQTTLQVKALSQKAAANTRNILVRGVTTSGTVRSIRTTCLLASKKQPGRKARALCNLKVRGNQVTARPTCSNRLRMTVGITAQRDGAAAVSWTRTWRVRGGGSCR